jgi:FAD/FMN-containing dehydrogenase
MLIGDAIGVIHMPLYTAITEEGTVPVETKAKIAEEITGLEILEDGRYVRIRPGTIISAANRALLPYGRVLGPDPASSGVATIGGGSGQQRQRDDSRHEIEQLA